MQLRDYQQRTIEMLYDWFRQNQTGNPCLVLPTGAGKSIIIAALVQDALTQWPDTRVAMVTHAKELIEQNASKVKSLWPESPLGIFSASIGEKILHRPITFAGIQSIYKHADKLGHIDLLLIDECHLISHKDEGQYRLFIAALLEINPRMRVVGLTATPYRLGHGMIHEGDDVLFSALIEPVTIEELVYRGFLAPLRSKVTQAAIDVSGVAKRGGEYIAGQLEAAADNEQTTKAIVAETLRIADHCRSIIFFCTGVSHAEHMAQEIQRHGVTSACITGATPKGDRERLIHKFRAGEIRCLTNANVLTTGFDAPDIDCVVLARPTLSPALYVQMAGRGMRLKSHTDHCLVLDFAGAVKTHGPITAVEPPSKRGIGQAPTKDCPHCQEIVSANAKQCPTCGFEFPQKEPEPPKPKEFRLHNDDIMGLAPLELAVTDWSWRKHISRATGKEMLSVTYYGGMQDAVTEYLCIAHDGWAGQRASKLLHQMALRSGINDMPSDVSDMQELSGVLNGGQPPALVTYKRKGKFFEVIDRSWQ